MPKDPYFPAILWNKHGHSRLFKGKHEIPAGECWRGTHPNNWAEDKPEQEAPAVQAEKPADGPAPLPAKVEPAAGLPLTREEIVAALDTGGVSYSRNTGTRKLYDLLVTTLKGVLKARGVAFDDAADGKTLLGLLSTQA
jgi:hypothetical protein